VQTAVRAHRTVSPLGTLLQEQDDEWQVAERRYFSIDSMTKIDAELEGSDFKEERLFLASALKFRWERL
jgi:hypothetical protein